MTISFDELDLLMQDREQEAQPQPASQPNPANSNDFLDFLKTGNGTDLEPIGDIGRAAAPEYDLNQHYSQVHSMDMSLGQGGELPTSFEIGVRPEYEQA